MVLTNKNSFQSELDSTKGDRPQLHVDSFAIVAYFSMCNWGLSPFVLLLGTVVVAVVVLFLLFLFVKAGQIAFVKNIVLNTGIGLDDSLIQT